MFIISYNLFFRLKFITLYMIKTIVLQPKVLAELLTFGTSSYEVREDYIYPVTLSQPFPFAGGSHTTIYVRQPILWSSTRENLDRKVKFRLQQVLIQILSNKLSTKALIRSAQSGLQQVLIQILSNKLTTKSLIRSTQSGLQQVLIQILSNKLTTKSLIRSTQSGLQQVLIQILSNKLMTKSLIRSTQSGLQLYCSQIPKDRCSRVAAHMHLIWPVHKILVLITYALIPP